MHFCILSLGKTYSRPILFGQPLLLFVPKALPAPDFPAVFAAPAALPPLAWIAGQWGSKQLLYLRCSRRFAVGSFFLVTTAACNCSCPPPFRNIPLGYPKFFSGLRSLVSQRQSFWSPFLSCRTTLFQPVCVSWHPKTRTTFPASSCVVQKGSFNSNAGCSPFFLKLTDFLHDSFRCLISFCHISFSAIFLYSCSPVQVGFSFQQLFEMQLEVSGREHGKGPACGYVWHLHQLALGLFQANRSCFLRSPDPLLTPFWWQ